MYFKVLKRKSCVLLQQHLHWRDFFRSNSAIKFNIEMKSSARSYKKKKKKKKCRLKDKM